MSLIDNIIGSIPKPDAPEGDFQVVMLKGGTITSPEGIAIPFRLHAIQFMGKNRKQRRRERAEYRRWLKRQK